MQPKVSLIVRLPEKLHDAAWEHADLKLLPIEVVVERALRAYLIREHGDDYGLTEARLDRLGMMERDADE